MSNKPETIRKFSTGAVRSADADTTRYDLISPIGLRRLAETYGYGAKKYDDNNWLKGFPAGDTLNHLLKHIEQWRAGDHERRRGEFGKDGKVTEEHKDHLAHAVWGLFALMHFEETRPELIDLPPWKGVFNATKGNTIAGKTKTKSKAKTKVGRRARESNPRPVHSR